MSSCDLVDCKSSDYDAVSLTDQTSVSETRVTSVVQSPRYHASLELAAATLPAMKAGAALPTLCSSLTTQDFCALCIVEPAPAPNPHRCHLHCEDALLQSPAVVKLC